MEINGLQKVTLIDFPGELACTIFLHGCNFKCGFCHNPELVILPKQKGISEEEFLEFLEKRKKYLSGVCITGGEPLISLNKEFLRKIKSLGYKIKIDTNGTFPERLKEFIENNLVDYIAMDIKSSKENYSKLTNIQVKIENIEKSIWLIANSGKDYEFRTTIIKQFHDKEEIKKMVSWLNAITNFEDKRLKKFVLQGFKNQGKFIDALFKNVDDVEKEYLEELKKEIENDFEKVEVRV